MAQLFQEEYTTAEKANQEGFNRAIAHPHRHYYRVGKTVFEREGRPTY